VVVGGGPAGLMAAEVLSAAGVRVELFDSMPSVGRKFLLAGKGGLNLTHAEPFDAFCARFGVARARIEPMLQRFTPQDVREWAGSLGVATFVGSSNRVFPSDLKAAPLLRRWLHRLRSAGVVFHTRHRWLGWDGPSTGAELVFHTPDGVRQVRADVVVLALGGASWPRLGSDAAWVSVLRAAGAAVAPLRSANCGFEVRWSETFRKRFAGAPVKTVSIAFDDARGGRVQRRGEFTIAASGVEGSLIYAVSAMLRDAIEARGDVEVSLDLAPDRTPERLANEIGRPRGASSWGRHLERAIGLRGVKAALLNEVLRGGFADVERLVAMIKSLPLRLVAARPIDEAISTAGGVQFSALDERLMLTAMPGVFCAGEMLDWEAPTGGYLLSACLASGRCAGLGALEWVRATM
jgi:uncharacterized flavoprotein (TIGR03862 family)